MTPYKLRYRLVEGVEFFVQGGVIFAGRTGKK